MIGSEHGSNILTKMKFRPIPISVQSIICSLIAFGSVMSSALAPRDLSMGESNIEATITADSFSSNVARVVTAVVLSCCFYVLLGAVKRHGLPRRGYKIWLAYMFYFVLNDMLPALTGEVPSFDYHYLYPAITFTAIYIAPPVAVDELHNVFKKILYLFIYGSLLSIILMPKQAIALDYNSLIPFLSFRLYGLGGATSLGPLSLLSILMEAESPSKSRWRCSHILAAAVVFILAQSKTAWFIFLAYLVYRMYKVVNTSFFANQKFHGKMYRNVFLFVTVIFLLLLATQLSSKVSLSSFEQGDNVRNLTGRSHIWESTIEAWRENPVFGYGTGLWIDEGFRAKYGEFAHAHNQFLHSLGSAGLVGLAGLLIYLYVLLKNCLQIAAWTKIPLAILLIILIISMTEVPLHGLYLFDLFTLIHVFLFAFLINFENSDHLLAFYQHEDIASSVPEASPDLTL